MHARMVARMYACMHVCMYVCMHACMCVYIYIYTRVICNHGLDGLGFRLGYVHTLYTFIYIHTTIPRPPKLEARLARVPDFSISGIAFFKVAAVCLR